MSGARGSWALHPLEKLLISCCLLSGGLHACTPRFQGCGSQRLADVGRVTCELDVEWS